MLNEEIERLNTLCVIWEKYKLENIELIAEHGGEDLINTVIGQTKLLTTKKLMQFSSLIDRCENKVKSTSEARILENDGSESMKPVLVEDLEGFWSMVKLQVTKLLYLNR